MSVKMGSKISEGACAEVFEWEDSKKVIKLAKTNTDRQAMEREYYNSKVAWDNGLSVPQPFELVDIQGRTGIVFERLYGETLMERFVKQFLVQTDIEDKINGFNYQDTTRITARILSEIHSKSILNMPSQREDIKSCINRVKHLTTSEKKLVVDILNNIPVKQQLCHGDPNPNNIFIMDDKPLLIDWMNCSIGNPEADLAEYIIMIRFAILPTYLPGKLVNYFNSIREEIINVFIDEYTKFSDITSEDIDVWITPIAARKLSSDGIVEDEKKLLVNEIRRRLKNMTSQELFDGYMWF